MKVRARMWDRGGPDRAYFGLSASSTAAMRLGSAASGSMPARARPAIIGRRCCCAQPSRGSSLRSIPHGPSWRAASAPRPRARARPRARHPCATAATRNRPGRADRLESTGRAGRRLFRMETAASAASGVMIIAGGERNFVHDYSMLIAGSQHNRQPHPPHSLCFFRCRTRDIACLLGLGDRVAEHLLTCSHRDSGRG